VRCVACRECFLSCRVAVESSFHVQRTSKHFIGEEQKNHIIFCVQVKSSVEVRRRAYMRTHFSSAEGRVVLTHDVRLFSVLPFLITPLFECLDAVQELGLPPNLEQQEKNHGNVLDFKKNRVRTRCIFHRSGYFRTFCLVFEIMLVVDSDTRLLHDTQHTHLRMCVNVFRVWTACVNIGKILNS